MLNCMYGCYDPYFMASMSQMPMMYANPYQFQKQNKINTMFLTNQPTQNSNILKSKGFWALAAIGTAILFRKAIPGYNKFVQYFADDAAKAGATAVERTVAPTITEMTGPTKKIAKRLAKIQKYINMDSLNENEIKRLQEMASNPKYKKLSPKEIAKHIAQISEKRKMLINEKMHVITADELAEAFKVKKKWYNPLTWFKKVPKVTKKEEISQKMLRRFQQIDAEHEIAQKGLKIQLGKKLQTNLVKAESVIQDIRTKLKVTNEKLPHKNKKGQEICKRQLQKLEKQLAEQNTYKKQLEERLTKLNQSLNLTI